MAASHFEEGTHHCAIFHGDDQGATHMGFQNCKLHPGHENFMTVDEFEKKVPSEFGLNNEGMSTVRNRIDRTVRVVVNHASTYRPDTFMDSKTPYPCVQQRGSYIFKRYGTGFLVKRHSFDVNEQCPCPQCKNSKCQTSSNQESYYFVIQTATHVIFDKLEAQNAEFEFFYDSEDREKMEKAYGVAVLGEDLKRLETDTCIVVCVTHDSVVAKKLGILCVRTGSLNKDGFLVSHPHGVSKRISISDRCIQFTVLMILNKTSVKLKKDAKIRFPDCNNDGCAVQQFNRLLGKPVIAFDDVCKTFMLLCDLTVYRPEGIVVEMDHEDYWINTAKGTTKNVWCNVFTPDTQLLTHDGISYTFPYKDDQIPRVKMEVLGNFKYFFDYNDIEKFSVYSYCRYRMASCPGSSGAYVKYYGDYFTFKTTGQVHFGNSVNYSTSSLICVYRPTSP